MDPDRPVPDGWERQAVEQQIRWLDLTPDQRLDWLEETAEFAASLRAAGRIVDVGKLRAEERPKGPSGS